MISFDEVQIAQWLSPIIWPFLRVLALFTSAPVLSSRAFPLRAKISLSFLIALAMQANLPPSEVIPINSPFAVAVAIQQVFVGLALGFSVRLVFAAVELAGEVVGFQMGLNFAAFFDPSLNAQSSAVARFFSQIASLLFVVMNGHILLIMSISKSFVAFPISPHFLDVMLAMRPQKIGAEIFSSALWIALPMLGILLFANMTLGIISRVSPQMNIFAIGFPITLVVGMLGIALTLPLLEQPFFKLMEVMLELFLSS